VTTFIALPFLDILNGYYTLWCFAAKGLLLAILLTSFLDNGPISMNHEGCEGSARRVANPVTNMLKLA